MCMSLCAGDAGVTISNELVGKGASGGDPWPRLATRRCRLSEDLEEDCGLAGERRGWKAGNVAVDGKEASRKGRV